MSLLMSLLPKKTMRRWTQMYFAGLSVTLRLGTLKPQKNPMACWSSFPPEKQFARLRTCAASQCWYRNKAGSGVRGKLSLREFWNCLTSAKTKFCHSQVQRVYIGNCICDWDSLWLRTLHISYISKRLGYEHTWWSWLAWVTVTWILYVFHH